MMRIIAGKWRGRTIHAPDTMETRPILDRAKVVLFDMLGHRLALPGQLPPIAVLDLFAGSGALGIEALSRGASWADFVDKSREYCTLIRQNLKRTGFSERAAVHCMAASQAIKTLERQYDVVFVDPPYEDASTDSVVAELAAGKLLAPGALVVVSHGNRHPLADSHGTLVSFKSRRYGDTFIAMYRREER